MARLVSTKTMHSVEMWDNVKEWVSLGLWTTEDSAQSSLDRMVADGDREEHELRLVRLITSKYIKSE